MFDKTIKWLDIYFNGEALEFNPGYKINNIIPFRKKVIDIMLEISYGKVVTYHDITNRIAKINAGKMSTQVKLLEEQLIQIYLHYYYLS